MHKHPEHKSNLDSLKRIEGQIRGIQKMVEEKRYCVDILTQLSAVRSAIARVQDDILAKHLHCCVQSTMKKNNAKAVEEKIDEITALLKTFRKNG